MPTAHAFRYHASLHQKMPSPPSHTPAASTCAFPAAAHPYRLHLRLPRRLHLRLPRRLHLRLPRCRTPPPLCCAALPQARLLPIAKRSPPEISHTSEKGPPSPVHQRLVSAAATEYAILVLGRRLHPGSPAAIRSTLPCHASPSWCHATAGPETR
jgi:hypothetical protein